MLAPEEPKVPCVDRYIRRGGLRLHYREAGKSSPTVAVVLHGIMGHARAWDVLVRSLGRSMRVAALDQRGHGESDWAESYTTADMVLDVLELIGELGHRRVHLIGHSVGAMIAMLLSAQYPDLVRSLTLIDVSPDSLNTEWGRRQLPPMLEAFTETSYRHRDEALAAWMSSDPLAREDLLRNHVEHALARGADGRWYWRFDGARLARFVTDGINAGELWSAVESISAPTLLLRGERSGLLTREAAHRMVGRLDKAYLVEIPNGGHDLGVQQQEAIATAALMFFATRGPQRRARRRGSSGTPDCARCR